MNPDENPVVGVSEVNLILLSSLDGEQGQEILNRLHFTLNEQRNQRIEEYLQELRNQRNS